VSWNPRYVAYARAHGNTPEHQSALDRERFPGGRMAGFMAWLGEQYRAFTGTELNGSYHAVRVWTDRDHAEVDDWLLAQTTRRDPTPSGSNQRRRVTTEQGGE
jgi:hypothetical protein